MTIYCDASVIVAALTIEDRTMQAQQWLEDHAQRGLAASLWVETEVASALAKKQRERLISDRQRKAAFAQWRELLTGMLLIPVTGEHFVGAAVLTERGLRAGDALHLAILLDAGAAIATGDRLLAHVATEYGVEVHKVG